jgi:2-hydroxychromene-2-carboxylate isomerase
MSRKIDYYFSLISPWAYIGHSLFMDIAKRHGVEINYKPVFLGRMFAETGGLPLNKRHPARQRYRMVELQRWREKRGLSFTIEPKHWPFDVNLADRFVIAASASHTDPDQFLRQAFAAIWERDEDLADPTVLKRVADEVGLDSEVLMELTEGSSTDAIYALNLENAIEAGVFGSPAYVLDGEVFWGQDRLELLDEALTSGRKAYTAEV